MLTAKGAKDLVLSRDEEIQKSLKKIEELIKEAAKDGKYEVLLMQPEFLVRKVIDHGAGAYGEDEDHLELTSAQHKIIKELGLMNYKIDYVTYVYNGDRIKISWY